MNSFYTNKVIQKKSIDIAPFCITHYDDPNTNTYYGVINYPTRIQTEDGSEKLECLHSTTQYGTWK